MNTESYWKNFEAKFHKQAFFQLKEFVDREKQRRTQEWLNSMRNVRSNSAHFMICVPCNKNTRKAHNVEEEGYRRGDSKNYNRILRNFNFVVVDDHAKMQ